jgi:hypothetical protein
MTLGKQSPVSKYFKNYTVSKLTEQYNGQGLRRCFQTEMHLHQHKVQGRTAHKLVVLLSVTSHPHF